MFLSQQLWDLKQELIAKALASNNQPVMPTVGPGEMS
jgi:hypothetical protein